MPLVGRRADKWQAMRLLTSSYEPQVQNAILKDLRALRAGVNVDALAVEAMRRRHTLETQALTVTERVLDRFV